ECAQDRKVETWVSQLKTQQVLPVDAGADRLRRLAIGEILPKLHDGHQRQPPRGQARSAPRREQGRKVVILKDGPEGIAEREIGMAFGKGGAGHTGRFFRYRRDDVWVERHASYPSAEWVQASERSRAVLCHSPLPRGSPQVRKHVADIFYYRKYFL